MLNKERKYLFIRILFLALIIVYFTIKKKDIDDNRFVTYIVNTQKQDLQFYWKDDSNNILKSIAHLKSWLAVKNKTLTFAMNAGMYKPDNSPQGLYIENQQLLSPIDTTSGQGNFYMKPNGIFYIKKNGEAIISNTDSFNFSTSIKFATQSGPMLLINGAMHPMFKKGSMSLNIRNGVGILPNNEVLFAMSKKEINFYDFALFFKRLGCKNALYLDGFVSRTFLPQNKWVQMDGNFGVIIATAEAKN